MHFKMTKATFAREARKRYGEDAEWKDIWFQCPVCKIKTQGKEWLEFGKRGESMLAFSCIGRLKETDQNFETGKELQPVGCNYTNGGLFQLHEIEIHDEAENHIHKFFNFAHDPIKEDML